MKGAKGSCRLQGTEARKRSEYVEIESQGGRRCGLFSTNGSWESTFWLGSCEMFLPFSLYPLLPCQEDSLQISENLLIRLFQLELVSHFYGANCGALELGKPYS